MLDFCEENNPCCLDFHHINPEDKLFEISRKRIVNQKFKDEIRKCLIVCANCHRKIHCGLINASLAIVPDYNLNIKIETEGADPSPQSISDSKSL